MEHLNGLGPQEESRHSRRDRTRLSIPEHTVTRSRVPLHAHLESLTHSVRASTTGRRPSRYSLQTVQTNFVVPSPRDPLQLPTTGQSKDPGAAWNEGSTLYHLGHELCVDTIQRLRTLIDQKFAVAKIIILSPVKHHEGGIEALISRTHILCVREPRVRPSAPTFLPTLQSGLSSARVAQYARTKGDIGKGDSHAHAPLASTHRTFRVSPSRRMPPC